VSGRRGPVRWREDVGFELRCDYCSYSKLDRYWPLSIEFWSPNRGFSRCKSCWTEYERAGHARRRRALALVPHRIVAEKLRKKREYQREWQRRWREKQREAEGRQRYERRHKAA
jgi:hypothetical protein